MSNLKASEMRVVDRVLEMESGYVLNFSDRTIAEFFLDELNIDFNDPSFAVNGTSKAKRLRTFLQAVDKATAARLPVPVHPAPRWGGYWGQAHGGPWEPVFWLISSEET